MKKPRPIKYRIVRVHRYTNRMLSSGELNVRRLMTVDPVCMKPTQTVQEALDVMNSRRIGAVLVAEGNDQLVGIFTERDFLRRVGAAKSGWRTDPLREWMSPYPYTIHPDAGWEEAVTSMERLSVRHLPVLENGGIVGILTARQLIARRANHLSNVVGDRTRELKRLNDTLLARDSELTNYIRAAARLQKKLVLPHEPPSGPGIAWGIHYAPLDPLGGDFYDFARPDPDHIGVLIADASGHGIPAAMIAIMASMAFSEASRSSLSPGRVLAEMNRRLQDMADDRFVTAFYGLIDLRTRRFTYASAGHPFPMLYRSASQTVIELPGRGFILGIMPEEQYPERTVELSPGDRILFFTDGVTDGRDDRGETFGATPLTACFQQCGGLSGPQIVEKIVAETQQFRGNARPVDDMTIVVAEVR